MQQCFNTGSYVFLLLKKGGDPSNGKSIQASLSLYLATLHYTQFLSQNEMNLEVQISINYD
jgi:hypothetical protein